MSGNVVNDMSLNDFGQVHVSDIRYRPIVLKFIGIEGLLFDDRRNNNVIQ